MYFVVPPPFPRPHLVLDVIPHHPHTDRGARWTMGPSWWRRKPLSRGGGHESRFSDSLSPGCICNLDLALSAHRPAKFHGSQRFCNLPVALILLVSVTSPILRQFLEKFSIVLMGLWFVFALLILFFFSIVV